MTAAASDAHRRIEQLVFALAERLDEGRYAEVPELFCDTLVFGVKGAEVGREGLVAQMAARASTRTVARHLVTNLRVQTASEVMIEALATALVFRPAVNAEPPLPLLCADWRVEARITSGGWRLKSLVIVPVVAATA